jgi:hypothetical protein
VSLVEASQTRDNDRIGALTESMKSIATDTRDQRDRTIRIEAFLEGIGRRLGVEPPRHKDGE